MIKKLFTAYLSLLILSTQILSANNTRAEEKLPYFKDIYYTRFKTVEQADQALKNHETDQQVQLEYANFYYVTGAHMPLKDKTGIEYIEKALLVYQVLWKKNFSDPRIQFLMANAYSSQGNNPKHNMGKLVEFVFRARNLYSMIIDRYPENLEARLGRARINMNLNAATGRPEAVHREDIRVYLDGYAKLPGDQKENPYFIKGIHEMYLALAMLDVENKQWSDADKNMRKIEISQLNEHAKGLYNDVQKKLGKELHK